MRSKQVIDQSIHAIIGKCIQGVSDLADDDTLCISFTDDTFIVLEASEKSVGYSSNGPALYISDYLYNETDAVLVEAGIVTEEEHQAAVTLEDEKYKAQYSKLQEQQKRDRLQMLREEYEKITKELDASKEK